MKTIETARAGGNAVLLLLFGLLVVACGGQSAASNAAGTAADTAPPVAYGASLSEWEEAMQEATAQPEASSTASVLPPPAVVSTVVVAGADTTREPAGDSAPTPGADAPAQTASQGSGFLELSWDQLVPPEFGPDAIMARYQEELALFEDGDPAAMAVYDRMLAEFNSAPVNQELNGLMVRLPGFIAPLEYEDDLITVFLLVPYFGACIHVPPPPPNQTVLVTMAEGTGIATEDSFAPIWVLGYMTAQSTTTELADAGYAVHSALSEPYVYAP